MNLHVSDIKIVLFLLLTISSNGIYTDNGHIIAFSGISGCGKSTLARILADDLQVPSVSEQEESDWPKIIKNREHYGPALAMLELRQLWATMFLDASLLSKDANLVFIDSYFFKIFGYYLNKEGMEWLVPRSDPYLPILLELNRLDQEIFPDATCVVLFDLSFEGWKLFLKSRGRNWDQLPGFAESYMLNRKYVEGATVNHCKKHSIKMIKFEHHFGDPYSQAMELKNLLILNGVIACQVN